MLKNKLGKFSLRKVAKKLISVSVGIIVSFIIDGHRNSIVKADELRNPSDDNEITELTNQVTKFGKIIPVNQNKEPIHDAPTPRYLHDPGDPAKAIATPIPVINDYVLAKDNQAANVDYKKKLVIPPLDPQQDTKVIYLKRNSVNNTINGEDDNTINGEDNSSYSSLFDSSYYYENSYYTGSQTLSIAQNQNSSNMNENESSKNVLTNNIEQNQTAEDNSNEVLGESRNNFSNITQDSVDMQTKIPSSDTTKTDDSYNLEKSSQVSSTFSSIKSKESNNQEDNKKKKEKATGDALRKNKKLEEKKLRNSREIMGKERKPNKKKNKKRSFLSRILPDVIMNQETKVPANPAHASLKIEDTVENKELKKIVVEGVVGKPIIFKELSDLIDSYEDKGYQVIKIQNEDSKKVVLLNKKDPFGFFGEEDKNFVLDLGHQLSPINPVNIPADIRPQLVKKKVLLLINYRGAGDKTPMNDLQVAFLTRTLTYDHVTKTLNVNGEYSTDWKPTPEYYKEVVSPEVPGYIAEPSLIPPLPVEMHDTIKIVNYVAIADERSKVIGSLAKLLSDLQNKRSSEEQLKKQEEKKRQEQLKKQEEKKRQEQLKKQEEKKRQEQLKKQEEKKRQEQLKKQEEKKRQEQLKKQEEKKRQEKLKKQEEKKHQEQLKKQEEKKHVKKRITERRYFVDQSGKVLRPERRMPVEENFPVIEHYILDSKNKVANGIIGVYKKLGKIIPVDIYGNLIPNPVSPNNAVASQYFANDKDDPTRALVNQEVPTILGYIPLTPRVTPANPEVDIPVVYEKER